MKKIKLLLAFVLSIILLLSSIPSYASSNLTTHMVFVDPYVHSEIEQIIKEYYGLNNMTNFTCTFKSSNFITLQNLSQSTLNTYYYQQTSNTVSGTCTAVSIVDLILFYKSTMNTSVSFKNLVYQAQQNGYSNTLGQILGSKIKNSISLCSSQNSVSGTGAEYTFNKRARTRNALNGGNPVCLSFDEFEHNVVAKGIEIYTISYTNPSNGRTTTSDVEFFWVNEGWGYPNGSLILSAFFSDSTGDAYILN